MSITAFPRGEWERYARDLSALPPETQEAWKNIIFMRRVGDGVDFNDVRAEFMTDDTVTVAASSNEDGSYTVVSASGGGMPAYPDGLHLFTIHGWSGPVEPLVRHYIDGATLDVLPLPDSEPPVPAVISDRQFFQQLAAEGTITPAEALAAVRTGELPAALVAILDGIPDEDERFSAEMLLSGATQIERAHPLTDAIGAATGRSHDDIDEFFRAAALL